MRMLPANFRRKLRKELELERKWYCWCCDERFKDEARYNTHCSKETHNQLHQIFTHKLNPNGRRVKLNSLEFESAFLNHIKDHYGSTRVDARVAYHAYVLDRHRYGLYGTKWSSWYHFVLYLGFERKCKVEETDQGVFITYIPFDFKGPLKK